MKSYNIGIDIGSTSAKAVVMKGDDIITKMIMPTGWSSIETSEKIRKEIKAQDISLEDSHIIATGYGRISVPYADKCMTEITCHAKGACHIYKEQNLLIIDIGGQDTKIIHTEDGIVSDFLMNDKCAAGTGRFLEVMANILGIDPSRLCDIASSGSDISISSMCTVFAESEVISLIGRGEKRENIAYAIVESIVQKVTSQAEKLKQPDSIVALTGGMCDMTYLKKSLSDKLGTYILSTSDGRYAGAIGAALLARNL